jgi:hypothetical protein
MIQVPHLETDITQACQLSCVACNHSVPLWREHGIWSAEPKQVEADLNHIATMLHADRWGALGGEPLLHSKLTDLLKIARDSRVADTTEVWTNGLLLQRQKKEFWRSFDCLVVSIYPGKLSDGDIDWIIKKCQDEGVEYSPRDERLNPNFKTMLEPSPTSSAQTLVKYNNCFFRQFSRCASYGFFFTCCCGPHIPMLIQNREYGTDGIKISGLTELDLFGYLTRKEPLDACYVCAGRDTAKAIPWSEDKNPKTWLMASAGLC